MDTKALHKITYGLYIVCSQKGESFNGQVANTAIQISANPVTVAVSINKQNLTNEYIRKSKQFTVSVLEKDTPMSLVGNFGFNSGRDKNKFDGVSYKLAANGVPYITEHVLSYVEAELIQEVDAGTHNIFIGQVNDGKVLKEGEPMTYAYYHQVKKGNVPKAAPTYTEKTKESSGDKMDDKYICTICEYVYDPLAGDPDNNIPPNTPFEKLPEDWECPVCGADKESFEKVEE